MMVPDKFKQPLMFVAVLVVLFFLAMGAGWGLRFLTSGGRSADAEPLTPEPVPPTAAPQNSPAATSPPPPAPSTPEAEARSTSTPVPTRTAPSQPETVVVESGESLYGVCRRHCAGCWGENQVPSSLEDYAQDVARLNQKSWNNGKPALLAGEELEMPSCPPECP